MAIPEFAGGGPAGAACLRPHGGPDPARGVGWRPVAAELFQEPYPHRLFEVAGFDRGGGRFRRRLRTHQCLESADDVAGGGCFSVWGHAGRDGP